MKMKMISPMIAGLVMVCAVYACAETNTPDKPSIDTPVSTVQMDNQGNIKQMTFRNGYVLKEPELNLPGEVVERGGVSNRRQLQFILGLTNSRRSPSSCFCLALCGGDCCPYDPQSLTFGAPELSGETTVIHLNPQTGIERVERPGGIVGAPPSSRLEQPLQNVREIRRYTLVEPLDLSTRERKIGVLVTGETTPGALVSGETRFGVLCDIGNGG
jgi:hypothetical protein